MCLRIDRYIYIDVESSSLNSLNPNSFSVYLLIPGPNKHQSAVTCLQFNSRFVITSSDDGTVKLWDVRTGEFIRNLVTLESGGSGGVVWRIRFASYQIIQLIVCK